jgi:uncharacterized protein (DUF697 family)
VKLRRPILVGGLGLSFSLWILASWHDSIIQVGELSLLSAIAIGGSLWLFQKNRPQVVQQPDGEIVDQKTVEMAIAQATATIAQLEAEAVNHPGLTALRTQLAQLPLELNRQEIQVAVTGGKYTGKSTVVELLKGAEITGVGTLHFTETAPLFAELSHDTVILSEVAKFDLVLFLTNGDLTDSEFQVLQQLKAAKQPTTLIFSKQDQHLLDERATVLQSLQQRSPGNVIAIAAAPKPIKVRKHQADGSVEEWMEARSPDIQPLIQHLTEIVQFQKQQLLCATTMRKAMGIKAIAKNLLNQTRGDRSTPIIEQYQWIAAAAAFANPVPALDLLATAAINAQMVMDLGNVYQQKISLEQAQTVAGTMGSLMLKLGLVELSTRTVTGLLKTNAATFVAGGLVEGVSAAYLTRIAGLSLVEYFAEQEIALDAGKLANLDRLRQTLSQVFQQNQQVAILQAFIKQGIKRLLPERQPTELVS